MTNNREIRYYVGDASDFEDLDYYDVEASTFTFEWEAEEAAADLYDEVYPAVEFGGLTFYAEQFASTSNEEVLKTAMSEYQTRLENGEAKETARVILPEGLVMSRLYVNGTVRSWMHYLDAREKHATQKEHRELAAQIRLALAEVLPLIFAEAA